MKCMNCFLCVFVAAVLISPAYALVIMRDQTVEVAADQIIDDDLVAFGNVIDVKGTVTGNVCAFAQTVNVSGDIGGLLVIGAASSNIGAKSVQTVWAAGSNLFVSGNVSKNLILAGGTLDIDKNARVGKDVRVYGGNFMVRGEILGSIKGGVRKFTMAGKSGKVKIKADKTHIESTAVISGDLDLTSTDEPKIDEGAAITGDVSIRAIEPEGTEPFFFAFAPMLAFLVAAIKFVVLISKIIVGVLLIALFQKYVRRIADTLFKETWKSLGWGFLGVIVIPIAAIVLFGTLVGYPLGLLAIYMYSVLLYVSSIFIAVVIGEKIVQLFKKGAVSLYLSFIIGILILFIVGFIPVLNFLVRIFVVLFGFGAVMLGTWHLVREMRGKELL